MGKILGITHFINAHRLGHTKINCLSVLKLTRLGMSVWS